MSDIPPAELAFLQQLDLVLCCLLSAIAVPTFLISAPSYVRILLHPNFARAHVFYIVVLEGVMGLLAFLSTMFFLELTTFPAFSGLYALINRWNLAAVASAITEYAGAGHLQAYFFLALNRFLLLAAPLKMKMNEERFFKVAIAGIFLLPLLAVPNCFRGFVFDEFIDGDEVFYFPIAVSDYHPVIILRILYTYGTALVTLVLNVAIAVMHYNFRRKLRLESRAERGLCITSVASFLLYVSYNLMIVTNQYAARTSLTNFIQFTTTHVFFLSTILPFWFLVAFSPSVRAVLVPRRMHRSLGIAAASKERRSTTSAVVNTVQVVSTTRKIDVSSSSTRPSPLAGKNSTKC